MLKIHNLSFGFGVKLLYEGVSFIVGKGQKVGLVGPNGSGKSTLLSIIRGEEEGYTGQVEVIGNVALVPQEVKHDPEMEEANSVRAYVDPKGSYQDHEIKRMFSGLELEVELGLDPKTLSGGQKTKLALARSLFMNPDILLLDEPTNFMDAAGKAWVMKFLSDYDGTVMVISHDLDLMDRAIDKVLAISPHNSTIEEYTGTYSDYQKLKKDKDERTKRELRVKSLHLKKAEERYQNMRAVAAKSVLKKSIEREKLALPEAPEELKKIKISLPTPKRVGELPLKASEISKSYGELKVLRDIDFSVIRGDKIAIIGKNGSGKSTLIKILLGITKPDSGEVVRNSQLSVGYYSQEFETFDFEKTVLESFCFFTNKDEGFARGFLGKFLFSNDKVFQRIGSLSGGEKTRLSIAVLTAQDNNLLILDEPTTYLDVLSQRIILEALKQYEGTMILVSHTPEFVTELKPNKTFIFPEQKMVFWEPKYLGRVTEI